MFCGFKTWRSTCKLCSSIKTYRIVSNWLYIASAFIVRIPHKTTRQDICRVATFHSLLDLVAFVYFLLKCQKSFERFSCFITNAWQIFPYPFPVNDTLTLCELFIPSDEQERLDISLEVYERRPVRLYISDEMAFGKFLVKRFVCVWRLCLRPSRAPFWVNIWQNSIIRIRTVRVNEWWWCCATDRVNSFSFLYSSWNIPQHRSTVSSSKRSTTLNGLIDSKRRKLQMATNWSRKKISIVLDILVIFIRVPNKTNEFCGLHKFEGYSCKVALSKFAIFLSNISWREFALAQSQWHLTNNVSRINWNGRFHNTFNHVVYLRHSIPAPLRFSTTHHFVQFYLQFTKLYIISLLFSMSEVFHFVWI